MCICLTAEGGHGGMAHEADDTILAAAHLITQFHTIVARNIAAVEPCVVSVCNIKAGAGVYNILPSVAEFGGTVRTFNEDIQDKVIERMATLSEGVGKSFGVTCKFE